MWNTGPFLLNFRRFSGHIFLSTSKFGGKTHHRLLSHRQANRYQSYCQSLMLLVHYCWTALRSSRNYLFFLIIYDKCVYSSPTPNCHKNSHLGWDMGLCDHVYCVHHTMYSQTYFDNLITIHAWVENFLSQVTKNHDLKR